VDGTAMSGFYRGFAIALFITAIIWLLVFVVFHT
jgi:hypothetical protein